MSEYTDKLLLLGKRCYSTGLEQRRRDITMPHPLTGSDITEPWIYFDRMYKGFHYDFVQRMAAWASMPAPNKIFAGIEAYATMLCDSKPAITIIPREPNDERFAAVAKAGLQYWWDNSGMENVIASAVKASRIYGTAWFHTYYDADFDTMVCETMHPSHIVVDPNCDAANFDPAYLVYTYRAQYGELQAKYDGKTLPDGSVVDFNEFNRSPSWTLETWQPNSTDQRTQDPISPSTTVNVFELHYKDPERVYFEDEKDGMIIKKSKKKYKRGRVITYAGGIVIDDKENPYLHGEFPFTPLFAYMVPGQFYGIGDVQMTMNIQIMRNRFAQLIIDNTMKSGGGWMFLGQGSGLKPSQISQGPFNIVPCKDVQQIRIERPPAPSRHVFDFINVLDVDFDDAMGIHEISRGATLTSHKTAQEIAVMAESDRTRVRQAARNLVWSLKRVSRQVMWGLAQFHKGDWFVRIAGDFGDVTPMEGAPGGEVETREQDAEFNGKMLLSNGGEKLKFDITFADDATLPNSQQQTFDKIGQLLQMGVITPEHILKYKLVDIPYADQIYMDMQKQSQAVPAVDPAAAGAGIPGAGGMPPVDPSMMGGVPPIDPSMMGGAPPMDMGALMGALGMGAPAGDGAPQISPQMFLPGMAAVPTQPQGNPLAALGIGETPMPEGGVDQELIGAMQPAGDNMPPEQIVQMVNQLAQEYGLPVEVVIKFVAQLLGISEDAIAEMMTKNPVDGMPMDMGVGMPMDMMGMMPGQEDMMAEEMAGQVAPV